MKIYTCWVTDDINETYKRHWFAVKKEWKDFIRHEEGAGRQVLTPFERDAPTNADGWCKLLNSCERRNKLEDEIKKYIQEGGIER